MESAEFESSVKSMQPCETSAVDEEPDDVDITATDKSTGNETASVVQVNGVSHNSSKATNTDDDTHNTDSNHTSEEANRTDSIEPHCIESFEVTADVSVTPDDDGNVVEEDAIDEDATHESSVHEDFGCERIDDECVDAVQQQEDANKQCDETTGTQTVQDDDEARMQVITNDSINLQTNTNDSVESIDDASINSQEENAIAVCTPQIDQNDDILETDVAGENIVNAILDEIVEATVATTVAVNDQRTVDEHSNHSAASNSTQYDGLVINEASADANEVVCKSKTETHADSSCTNADAIEEASSEMETEPALEIVNAPASTAIVNELINTDVINVNEEETPPTTITPAFSTSDEPLMQQSSPPPHQLPSQHESLTLELLNGDSNGCADSSNSSSSSSSSSSSNSSSNHCVQHNSRRQSISFDEILGAIDSRPSAKRKLSTDPMDDAECPAKQPKLNIEMEMNIGDSVVDTATNSVVDSATESLIDIATDSVVDTAIVTDSVTNEFNGNNDDPMSNDSSTSAPEIQGDDAYQMVTNYWKTIIDNHSVMPPVTANPTKLLELNASINASECDMLNASNSDSTKGNGYPEAKHVNGFADESGWEAEGVDERVEDTAMRVLHTDNIVTEMKESEKQQLLCGPLNENVVNDTDETGHRLGLQTMPLKCFKCESSAFTTLAELKDHYLECLRNSICNLENSIIFDTINGNANVDNLYQQPTDASIVESNATKTFGGSIGMHRQESNDNKEMDGADDAYRLPEIFTDEISTLTNATTCNSIVSSCTTMTTAQPMSESHGDSSKTISLIDTRQPDAHQSNAQTRARRQVFLCSACGTYFEKWNLFYHIREVHKKFICLFCLGIFPSAHRLVNHLESKHIATPNVFEHRDELMKSLQEQCYLMCCVCEYIFSEADDFTGHSCETYMKPCSACGLKFFHASNCKIGTTKPTPSKQKSAKMTATDAKRRSQLPQPKPTPSQLTPTETQWPQFHTNGIQMDPRWHDLMTTNSIPGNSHPIGNEQLNAQEKSNARPGDSDSSDNESSSDGEKSKWTTPNNENHAFDGDATKLNHVNRMVKPLRLNFSDHSTNNVASKRKIVHPGKNMNLMVNQEANAEHYHQSMNGNDNNNEDDGEGSHSDQSKQRVLIPHYVRDESVDASSEQNNIGKSQTTQLLVPKLKLKISREFQTSIESEDSSTESDEDEEDENDDSSAAEDNPPPSQMETDSIVDAPVDESAHHIEAAAPFPMPLLSTTLSEEIAQIQNLIESTPEVPPSLFAEYEQPSIIANTIPTDEIMTDQLTDIGGGQQFDNIQQHLDDAQSVDVSLPLATAATEENSTAEVQAVPVPEHNEQMEQTDDIVVDDVESEPAVDTRSITEFILEQPLDRIPTKEFVRKCLESTFVSCLYCNHARRIAVSGPVLAAHMIEKHRFSATVDSITAEELLPDTIEQKISAGMNELEGSYFNLATYESGTPNDGYVYTKSFECFECRFCSPVYKDLYLHNRKMHLRAALSCHMCNCNFFSYSELVCHMCPGASALMIPIDIKFRCVLCNLDDIPSAFRLMVHLRKKHSACDVCLEECLDQSRLSCHVWKHKLHHLCYRCNITYRNKADITRHLFWKHGTESVLCKRCLEKKWPHVYHFCVPPTTFGCEICGSTFTKAVALKVHKRLHIDDGVSYACTLTVIKCGKKFISRKLRDKHMSRHFMPALPPWPLPPYVPEKEEIDEYDGDDGYQINDKFIPNDIQIDLPTIKIDSPQLPTPTITLDEEVNAEARDEAMPSAEEQATPIQEATSADVDPKKTFLDADIPTKSGGEPRSKKKFRRNKSDLSDILDLPTLNLSESDSSSDSENESPSAENSLHSFSAVQSQADENDLGAAVTIDDDDEVKTTAPINDIWDNFKTYQASQVHERIQDDCDDEKLFAEHSAILHVSQSDHDYCMMYKAIAAAQNSEKDSVQQEVSVVPVIELNAKGEIQVTLLDVPVVEPLAIADFSSPNHVNNVENEEEICAEEKSSTEIVENESVTVTTTPKKSSQRKRSVSSSSDSSSSSSSCSCGSNCSCSSSSSGSSSSSSDSDSDSSNSENQRRKKQSKSQKSPIKAEAAARKAEAKEAAANKESSPKPNIAISRSQSPKTETNEELVDMKGEPQHPEETSATHTTPKQETADVDVVTTETKASPPPDPDTIILDSDLETSESETDEEFYDEHPQKLSNQLLAEKRKELMMQTYAMSDFEPNSRSTTPLLPIERNTKSKVRKRKRIVKGKQSSPRKTATMRPPSAAKASAIGRPSTKIRPFAPHPSTINSPTPAMISSINPIAAAAGQVPTTPNNIRLSTSSCSDADSSLKRSKRRRIPNKFYGYTSDDDSLAATLPRAPPTFVWNKEDLPSKPTKTPKPLKPMKISTKPAKKHQSLKTIIRFGSDGLTSRAIASKITKNHRKMALATNARKRPSKLMMNKAKTSLGSSNTTPTVPKLIIRPFGNTPKLSSTPSTPTTYDQHKQQSLPPPHALHELMHLSTPPTHHIAPMQVPPTALSSDDSDSDSDSSSDDQMKIVQSKTELKAKKSFQWISQNYQEPSSTPAPTHTPMPFQQIRQHVLPPINHQPVQQLQPQQQQQQQQQQPPFVGVPMFNGQPLDTDLINKPNQIRYPIRPPIGCRSQAHENESVYCYCRCPYDDVTAMIACDATNCPIEWFHFECVGIIVAPQDKWYCPQCRSQYTRPPMISLQTSSVINHFVDSSQLQQTSADCLPPVLHQQFHQNENSFTSPSIT